MIRSINRFLTTHAGSLPRPDDLVRIMYAKEEGRAVDRAELATHIRDAVARVVAQQKETGIDIVSDGEMSKPSYATYIKGSSFRLRRYRQHICLPRPGGFPEPCKARI
jgi:5-methyltetrahydropteroyltriglutamate--homocysteine methyltransferase